MTEILRGKAVAQSVKDQMIKDIEVLAKENKVPKLAIVRLGNNSGDISYEKSLIKNCTEIGIEVEVFERSTEISTEDLVGLLKELNEDNKISGILVFRPLPKHIDEEVIKASVDPRKDVDCMHPLNLESIFEGDMSGFAPCTPKAAMEILNYYNVELEGKHVVVVNRSMVVGKPLVMMLLEKNATVTICHSRTKNLSEMTKSADVVAVALGRAKFFTEEYFNEDSVVIDIGVSMDENNKLSGDTDYDNVVDKVSMITPVPGGVGAVTTSLLLSHVVHACKNI